MEGQQMIYGNFEIEVETDLLTGKEKSKVIPLSRAEMATTRATKNIDIHCCHLEQ